MSDWWNENLLPAKLDGVEFVIVQRKVTTGRQFARYKYPYRNGQGVEDLGRKTYIFHLTLPLFRGVAPNLYPGTFDKLLKIVEDEQRKAEVEYVDPEFGPLKVKVADFDWDTSGDRRDGGFLTLVLEERAFEQSLTENLSKPQFAKRSIAKKRALEIDFALDSEGASFQDITGSKNFSLTDAYQSMQDALDSGALAADDIAAKVDEVSFVAQKIISFSAEDELARWSIVNSVVDFVGAIQDVGEDSGDGTPGEKLVEVVLPDTLSMYEIATRYHGDPSRAEEIAFNNPTQNPLSYPRGSVIRVAQ